MELLTIEGLLSLTGMSAFILLVVQLLKRYIPDWRFTNLVAMGVGLVFGVLVTWIIKGLNPRTILDAILLALVAGATSSGLFETVANLRGVAGSGNRADS
jgi:hypothetical protein